MVFPFGNYVKFRGTGIDLVFSSRGREVRSFILFHFGVVHAGMVMAALVCVICPRMGMFYQHRYRFVTLGGHPAAAFGKQHAVPATFQCTPRYRHHIMRTGHLTLRSQREREKYIPRVQLKTSLPPFEFWGTDCSHPLQGSRDVSTQTRVLRFRYQHPNE